jgi:transcriptional regulator with XRE-family HTH domain
MEVDSKLYDSIKDLRKLKEISRENISEQLGMTVSGYSKIERGEVDVQISKLYKIAEILNVEVAKLLNFKERNIFNFNNSKNIQTSSVEPSMKVSNDVYLEKYAKLLEAEIIRLKGANKGFMGAK